MTADGGAPAGRMARYAERLGLPRQRSAVRYGAASLINSLGTGLFYPFSVLFFHHQLGLSIVDVGFGLSLAAFIAISGISPAGRVIDRLGARPVLVVSCLLRGAVYLGFLTGPSFPLFVVLSAVEAMSMRVGQLSDQAVVAELASRGDDSRWYALSRTCFNAGMGVGSLVAGVLVVTTGGYALLALCNAVSFCVAALIFVTLPSPARDRADGGETRERRQALTTAWKDSLFLLVAAANALLWLFAMAIEIALPVYLKEYAHSPAWTISLVFALNTLIITGGQLPLGRRTEHTPRMKIMAWGGVSYAVAFLILLPAVGTPLPLLVGLLIVSVSVFTVGEILVTVSGTVATTRLAPPERRGSYLAASHLMLGISGAVAPLALTWLLHTSARLLWSVIGLGSLVLAVLLIRLQQQVETRAGTEKQTGAPTSAEDSVEA